MLNEAMDQIRNNKYYEKYVNNNITSNNITLLAIAFNDNKDISCKFEKFKQPLISK
jgi:hypothetical protein